MKSVISRIRRRLDTIPLWAVALGWVGVMGLWMIDIRSLDPLPFLDEIFFTVVTGATALYVWNRMFGPPTATSAESRRRLAEVESLYEDAKRVPAAASEMVRLGTLLEKVRAIQGRIEQAEIVLASPQYSTASAAAEIARLEAELARASDAAKANLEGALAEARKHAENVARIHGTRDTLKAAFERTYQIIRRIHSQVLALGLAQGGETELSGTVDELARALEEQEKDRVASVDAEALLERELEEARRKQRQGQTTT